jgi:methyl-accepting chemotaxis protein
VPAVAWILLQSTSPANLAVCAGLVLVGLGACAWSAGSQRDAVQRAAARALADQSDADVAQHRMAARAQLDEVLLGAMPIWAKQVESSRQRPRSVVSLANRFTGISRLQETVQASQHAAGELDGQAADGALGAGPQRQ